MRSGYLPPLSGNSPVVLTRDLTGSALHEYAHHLQFSMGEKFNALWRTIYLRRTTFPDGRRHPLEPRRPDTPDKLVRDGGFFGRYPGREYPDDITRRMNMAPGDPVELATTHIQAVLADYSGGEMLARLAADDGEMLHSARNILDTGGWFKEKPTC